VVKYEFSRAKRVPLSEIQAFVVELARRIERGQNIVYFDETSCNMWMRKRYSWCTREQPVRMHLNKDRGHGITILGAIGHRLPEGVFSLAKSTNQTDVAEFLKKLRGVVTPYPFTNRERIVLVVDNHPSHGTAHVREVAEQLNIELLFLPPYSPELNSIESLWAIFKLDLKNRLQAHKDVELAQSDFKQLVR
jgi:transposase